MIILYFPRLTTQEMNVKFISFSSLYSLKTKHKTPGLQVTLGHIIPEAHTQYRITSPKLGKANIEDGSNDDDFYSNVPQETKKKHLILYEVTFSNSETSRSLSCLQDIITFFFFLPGHKVAVSSLSYSCSCLVPLPIFYMWHLSLPFITRSHQNGVVLSSTFAFLTAWRTFVQNSSKSLHLWRHL